MNADRELAEARRLRKLLEEVARITDERRNEPATMPEGGWPGSLSGPGDAFPPG